MHTLYKPDQIEKLGYLALGSRLKRISDILMQDVKKIYKYNNIDFEPRWFTLFSLIKDSPGISLTEASLLLRLTHAAVSQSASQMAKKGIIELVKSDTDERSKAMKLTPEGEKLATEMEGVWSVLEASVHNIANETHFDILEMLKLLEESLSSEDLFARAAKLTRERNYETVEIISFEPDNNEHIKLFEELNIEWLEKFFVVEETDRELFKDPQNNIINKDGAIIFARVDGKIIGTGAIFQKPEGHYELGKICVTDEYKGRQIGKKLTKELIGIAKKKNLEKLYLVSNTILTSAINLYRKLGFIENNEMLNSEYERTNIAMELDLSKYKG